MTYALYGNSAYPYNWADEYSLFDQFITARSAGAVNGTSAEPVGGTRTVTDASNKISITGGKVSFATGATANSGIWYSQQTRSAGKTLLTTFNVASGRFNFGWDSNQAASVTDGYDVGATGALRALVNATAVEVSAFSFATDYQVALVMRDTGMFYYIKGGIYTNWTLLYISSLLNSAYYPGIVTLTTSSVFTADNIRVPVATYIPVPLASDGFSATTTDGQGNAENNGTVGTAYTAVGTWGVSGGSLSCSALSGGLGFRYLNGVSADALIDLSVTRSGGNAGIVARYVDANNYLIAYHDGTNTKLDKVVAGVTTNLISAAATYGAARVLRLILDGTSARLFYNNAAVGSAATVPSSTSTNHGIYTTNTGNTFDNFVVWARGNSSTYYSGLDALDNLRYYGIGTWPNILWGIAVDWDGDGLYDSTNEAMYAVSLQTRRGRDAYLNIDADGNASGFEPVRVGAATLIMDNSSRRYDPYNTSSPLYPNVIAGKNIQIRVADPSGNIYYVITGKIRSITTQDDGYEQTATFEIEDGMRLLQSTDATVDLQQDPTIDEAIGLVLDDVNWPTLWGRNLDVSADVIPYWWGEDKASTELRRLAEAELGEFFVAANGAATFRSRSHADVAVLTLDSSDFLKNINVALPWEVIRNQVKVYANPRVVQTATDLWTMQDVPSIAPGASLTVWANYQYNGIGVPAINVIPPVMTTDYTANTAADGTGTDRTSILYITLTDFGKSGKLVITNTGADTVYITLMKVRGDAISKPDATLVQDDDATSQGIYGKAQLVVNNDWIQTTAQAGAISGMLIGYLPNPQKTLTVRIEARPDIQFTPDLFDTLDVTIDALGITNVTYRVTSIEHRWTVANGQSVLTTWKIEPDPNFA